MVRKCVKEERVAGNETRKEIRAGEERGGGKKNLKIRGKQRTWKALGQITKRENTNGGISFYLTPSLHESHPFPPRHHNIHLQQVFSLEPAGPSGRGFTRRDGTTDRH